MNIHFCDLCNESVPQTDLDEGRAFLRKGRVVCAACDRSMSGELQAGSVEFEAGPFDRGNLGGALGTGVTAVSASAPAASHNAGQRRPGGLAGSAPAAPVGPPTFGGHPAFGTMHAPASRSRGAGAAVAGLALMGLLFTAGLGFWVSGRIDELDRALDAQDERLGNAQYDASIRFDQRLDLVGEELGSTGEALRAELRQMRDWLNGEIAEGQLQAREVRARLDEFGQRIETMAEAFGNVRRHDQELIHLQQRYTDLTEAFDGLVERAAQTARGGAVVPQEPEVAAAEPAAPPPWMGLVEQLASPNTSERWQAVVALGETVDPAVSDFLLPSLQDEDIFIRMVTARVLGDLGNPIGIPALIDALGDPESPVREAAYVALKALTRRDLPFDPESEDAGERARRIKAWREWWDKEKDRILP